MNLSNKNVFITGATSGIGLVSTKAVANAGANILFSGRNHDVGEHICDELSKKHPEQKFVFFCADLLKQYEIDVLWQGAINHFGQIHCAFNNAGIEGETAKFGDSNFENWTKVLDTNLNAVWRLMKKQVNHMLQHGYGNIVNMSSTSGLIGNGFGMSAYAASKHAIIGLSKSVALEYAKENIRVNILCPGFIETPMVRGLCEQNPKLKKRFLQCHPIGRFGKPEEIANALVYLLSDDSAFMTGHNMILDGGLTI